MSKQDLEEWMDEERARLKEGFTFEPQPTSPPGKPDSGAEILAGVGLGAGVVGGALAPHADTVTFAGCRAGVIVEALKSEIAAQDTRVQTSRSGNSVVVTILQSQASRPGAFYPALTVTLLEAADELTVTVSDLDQDAKRGALGSIGRTALNQGKRLLFRRRGIVGLIQTASAVIDGVEDVVEDIQDLQLPKQVWEVIDRVGQAAEQVYLEEQRREREAQRQREEAEMAWLYCPSCGRAYREDEASRVDCPACGAPRGPKPAWMDSAVEPGAATTQSMGE